jgi:hypothetical protein
LGKKVCEEVSDFCLGDFILNVNFFKFEEGSMNIKWRGFLAICLGSVLVACPPAIDPNAIATIEVLPTNLTLEVGQSASGLSATAKNASGTVLTDKTFTWASSDSSIATVSTDGKVTALKGGAVSLTASSEGKSGTSNLAISFTLRVRAQAHGNSPVTVFTSKADGTLLESKTVNPAPDSRNYVETLEFKDLPGDALVTAAYNIQKPINGVIGDLTRLYTTPAAYANGQGFFLRGNYEFVGNIFARLEKPAGATHTRRFLPGDATDFQSFGGGDARDLPAAISYFSTNTTPQLTVGVLTDAIVQPNPSSNPNGKVCFLNNFSTTTRYVGLGYVVESNNANSAKGFTCSLRRADGAAMGTSTAFTIGAVGTVYELEMGSYGLYRITLDSNTNGNYVGTARPYVRSSQGVYTYDLQKNGLYSPLFIAYDANDNPVAYKFLKNRTMPSGGSDVFEVLANQWDTNLTQTTFAVTVPNSPSYWCPSLMGFFEGISSASLFDCRINNYSSGLYTITRKFAPGFDKYGFSFGFAQAIPANTAGAPSSNTRLQKNDLAVLPANVSLNATTDFMPFIDHATTSLVGAGTARPGLNFAYTGDSSKLEQVSGFIYERNKQSGNEVVQQPGLDYDWTFWQFPSSTRSLVAPELPSSLAALAPIEGSKKYRMEVALREPQTTTSRREAWLQRNLSGDTAFNTASSRSKGTEAATPRKVFEIGLQ